MRRPNRFTVEVTAEIEHHIGKCTVYCVGYSPSDYEVECLENQYGGHLECDQINDGVMREIDQEVGAYFAEAIERAREESEDVCPN